MAEEEQVPLYVHGNNEDDNLSLSSNVSVTSISRMKQGMATGAAYIAKRLLPTIQEDPSNIAKLPEYLNVITKTSEELTALAVEDLQTNSVYVEAKRNSLKQADMIAVHVKTYESFEKEKMELEAKLAKVAKTMKAAKDKADMHQHAKDYFDKIVSKHDQTQAIAKYVHETDPKNKRYAGNFPLDTMLQELNRSEASQWDDGIEELEALGRAADNMGFRFNEKAPKKWIMSRIKGQDGLKRESVLQLKHRFMKEFGFEAKLKRKISDLDAEEQDLEAKLEELRRRKKLKLDLEATKLAYKQAEASAENV